MNASLHINLTSLNCNLLHHAVNINYSLNSVLFAYVNCFGQINAIYIDFSSDRHLMTVTSIVSTQPLNIVFAMNLFPRHGELRTVACRGRRPPQSSNFRNLSKLTTSYRDVMKNFTAKTSLQFCRPSRVPSPRGAQPME